MNVIQLNASHIEKRFDPSKLYVPPKHPFRTRQKPTLQQQLKENISLLEATLDCTTDGILVVNHAGKVVRNNKKFLELFKIPKEIADTRDDDTLLAFVLNQLSDPEPFIAKIRWLYAQPDSESFEELSFKDGRVFERISKPQYVGGQSVGRVWSFRDVTLQKNAERELNAILEQEKKLRIKAQDTLKIRDEFLAIASHELRTPLAPLSLLLQTFNQFFSKSEVVALPEAPAYAKMLNIAKTQVDRLERLVDDLLDASRIRTGCLTLSRESFDLTEMVRSVTDYYASKIKSANCKIDLQLQDKVLGSWDPLRLEQVMTNLLSNAIKFGEGKPIVISLNGDHQQVVLSIEDFGIGILEEDQSRIFERFERAVSMQEFGGLGLGLYIVHQIVTSHHGSIKVESSLGKGSKFIVTLPFNPR